MSTFRQLMMRKKGIPSRYQEVEYIESTGTQYINTGLKGNQDTTVILDCFYNARQNADFFFGTYKFTPSVNNSFSIGHNTTGNTTRLFSAYGSQVYTTNVDYSQRCIISLAKNKLYFNDTLLKTFNEETFNTIDDFRLFASRYDNSTLGSTLKVYSCQIYDNGVLVRNFIPVYDTLTQKYGMWESVQRKFYGNDGTGDFLGA